MKNRGELAQQVEDASHETQELQRELTRALSRQPAVTVPEGFAARVAASLPERDAVRARPRFSVGRAAAIVAALALAVAMFVLSPHVATARSLGFAVEMLLLAQLAGIGYGLVRMTDHGL